MEKPPAQNPRDVMEEAARELETEALIRRMNAGNDPLTPVADTDQDDGVPAHEIPAEHQVPPQQVIEEEGLGSKE